MPRCRFMLGLVASLSCWAPSAPAVLIETAGTQVGGYLVREDDKKLSIRIQTPDGEEKVVEYARDKIKIVHQVDAKRLEGLSKDNPKGYLDYAEELARLDDDPEAKYLARRLYLIVARLDPQNRGTSSLLRLSELAGTRAEARRCRALAYLLDPKGDAKLIAPDEAQPAAPNKAQAEGLQDFVKAMRSYRAGKVKLAAETAGRKGMDKVFALPPGDPDQKTFLRMCADAKCMNCKSAGKIRCTNCMGKGVVRGAFGGFEACGTCAGKKLVPCSTCDGRGVTPDLSEGTLRVLLRAELSATERLLGEVPGGKAKKGQTKSWSSVLQSRRIAPASPLSLETITEFDPRKCQYRNGKWVAPAEDTNK